MKEFAVNYSFENVISSPKYPQSNTDLTLLKKLRDRIVGLQRSTSEKCLEL